MKNKDANNKPILILVLSAIFILGGFAGLIAALKNDFENKTLLIVVTIILIVVGILFLVYGILRQIALSKNNKLLKDPNAYETTATFVSSKLSSYSSSSVGVGGINLPTSMNVYKKIIYSYTDEQGVQHTVKSTTSYFPNQVEFLKQKGTFKIKCKGKLSVITEEVPETNSRYNL